jgi:Neuraminidase (sialidase)
MKKDMKFDMKLTKKVADSLSVLKHGVKNSLVMGAVDGLGLSTIPSSKVSSDPLKKGLNFTSFKAGIAGTSKEIIPAPACSFLGEII